MCYRHSSLKIILFDYFKCLGNLNIISFPFVPQILHSLKIKIKYCERGVGGQNHKYDAFYLSMFRKYYSLLDAKQSKVRFDMKTFRYSEPL